MNCGVGSHFYFAGGERSDEKGIHARKTYENCKVADPVWMGETEEKSRSQGLISKLVRGGPVWSLDKC